MTARCSRPGCDRPAVPRPDWMSWGQLCQEHLAELNGRSGAYGKPFPAEQPRRPNRQSQWPKVKFHS
jgi:hypothetical protein